jgi:glycosyltransferase involved in cell wall biosynthesis
MKVLYVLDSVNFGGAENLLVTLMRAAPSAGFRFEVVTVGPRGPGAEQLLPIIEASGVRVRFLDIPRLLHPAAVPRLAAAIRDVGPDVVHAHLEAAVTLSPVAAALARRPAVCTLHHVPGPISGRAALRERLAVAAAGRSRRLIFVSQGARDAFAHRFKARPSWTVLHNGVDLDQFHPGHEELPADLGIPNGVPVVALIAVMRAPKRHDDAIRAWPGVLRRSGEARLLLVGAGPEEERLRDHAERLGVTDRVIFAGARHDVPRLLRGVDLAVLPSETEALPTTLIEAAASGRAAVATPVGGTREVVEDGVNGLLVPVGDTEGLATAVADLLTDAQRRASMGAAGRRLAVERFDMLRWAGRLRALYEDVAPRGRG